MSTLGGNLRSFLLADPGVSSLVGDKIFQNKVPQLDERQGWPDAPYIWFTRSGTDPFDCLDQEVGSAPYREYFDFECCSPTVGEEIQLARAVWDALNRYRGMLVDIFVLVISVQDHSDEYVYRNLEADDGLSVAALNVEIVPGRN